jgi:hypothetical protein
VNYTEKYEVRLQNEDHPYGVVWDQFDNEADAISEMMSMDKAPGSWRVVRVMEVIVASVAKA